MSRQGYAGRATIFGMAGTLWIVGTPIGNLGDLSERARQTLASVDLVVAEDTRRTGRLLQHLGVAARQRSLFEGNERERVPAIVAALADGDDVALVSDGGMPLVSDPGYRLVRAAIDAGIDVRVVPGPSAVLAALVVSGLPADRFTFEGFASRTAGERRARLADLADDPRTVVFFESPRRVAALLAEIARAWGPRRVAVCRELTKLHEDVVRGPADEVAEALVGEPPRGEVVVVVEGHRGPAEPDVETALAEAKTLIASGARKRDAARAVSERTGVPANVLYGALVEAER
jgi:16S rRNA (cytidine1402-2'-O)-methyltransferase